MQPHVPWLTLTDIDVLRFLAGHRMEDFQQPPTAIAINLNKNRSTISEHLQYMSDAGLAVKTDSDRGYYKISDLGRRYLNEELSEEELEDLREFSPRGE